MKFTNQKIKEIADTLDCGMICYIHKETQEIKELPDQDDPYFEGELWEDMINEIESNIDQYIKVDKMSSREAFQVMADFTEEVTDEDIKTRLVYALNRNRPFQNFKYEVGFKEEIRQLWFAFKAQKYQEWVRQYLHYKSDEEE